MKYLKLPFEILSESKKARALIVSVLIVLLAPLAAKLGYVLTSEHLAAIVTLATGYMVGQGISDNGKGAEQLRDRRIGRLGELNMRPLAADVPDTTLPEAPPPRASDVPDHTL